MVDENLLLRIKAGDQRAFRELYDNYKEKVYTTAYFVMSNKDVLEDILQEVFVQVFLKVGTLKDNRAFEGWLYRITVNICMKHGRVLTKNAHISDEDVINRLREGNVDNIPEVRFIQGTINKEVMNLINELPENQRISIMLFYFNNMSIKEIAYATESSETAVKARLFKAKKSLKKELRKKNIEEGILIGY